MTYINHGCNSTENIEYFSDYILHNSLTANELSIKEEDVSNYLYLAFHT